MRSNSLWSTARELRHVQAAQKRFMTLWAIDRAAELLDRQWAAADGDRGEGRIGHAETADWKVLYRGSVLDD